MRLSSRSMPKRYPAQLVTVLMLCSVFTGAAAVLAHDHRGDDRKLVGYFIEWGVYDQNYLVKNVVSSGAAAKLTHIN